MFHPKWPLFTVAVLAAWMQVRAQDEASMQESIMVIEAYSGKVLVASNAAAKRPIASLTKIATGAVTVDLR